MDVMKRALVFAVALMTLGMVSPAFAGSVYVLVVDPRGSGGSTHATELWLSNGGTGQMPVKGFFVEAFADGTKRTGNPAQITVEAGRTFLLGNAGVIGKYGLLELDASGSLAVEARLKSTSADGSVTTWTAVPVISSENLLAAGQTAFLNGLERTPAQGNLTGIGVVNLGKARAQCTVKAFRADGTAIGPAAGLSFEPLSLQHYADAFLALGAERVVDGRATVTCDQPFYAFATLHRGRTAQLLFATPAQTGASTLTSPGEKPTDPPSETGAIVLREDGVLHVPTRENPAREIKYTIDNDLRIKKMIVEIDFIPGAWNAKEPDGNHALLWVHRGKYRSGTIANVNVFGPGKNFVKNNQNIDLPIGKVTSREQKTSLERGRRYHLRYVYDAQANDIQVVITSNGQEVNNFTVQGTTKDGVLVIPKTGYKSGLVVQFGHFPGQDGPEVPTFGWQYENLKIQMVR
jgi:hypothetical protein